MKLLLLLLATALAYHKFSFRDEDDMLQYMRDEDHHIYVLFFYNGNQMESTVGPLLKERNDVERMRVQNLILEKFPQVAFADCEVSSGRFDGLMTELGVEKDVLSEFPTIAIVDDGNGKWVHGPNATPFAADIVGELAESNPVPTL